MLYWEARLDMGKCKSPCSPTGSLSGTGKRLMKAQPDNSKYKVGEIHPQCQSCLDEMLAEADRQIKMGEDPLTYRLELLKIKQFWLNQGK
jgi:hypothetical protein